MIIVLVGTGFLLRLFEANWKWLDHTWIIHRSSTCRKLYRWELVIGPMQARYTTKLGWKNLK